jgi:hypothetical protein
MHHIQNQFPILKYVPDWFLGAGFKQQAKEWSVAVETMVNQPMEVTRKNMVCSLIFGNILYLYDCEATGDQLVSFASESLPELEGLSPGTEYADLENVIKDTAAVMYVGKMIHFTAIFTPLLTWNAWQLGLKPYVYAGPRYRYSL